MLRVATGSTHPLRATKPAPPWISPRSWARASLWIAEYVLRPATEMDDALDEMAHIIGVSYERTEIDPAPKAGRCAPRPTLELAKKVAEQVDMRDAQAAQYYAYIVASHRMAAGVLDRDHFLQSLDDEIFRLEAGELIAEYGGDADAIEAVLWRGEGKKGRLGRCIVRMADGYGIVMKLKGRYQWFAGGRDNVIATVPMPSSRWRCQSSRRARRAAPGFALTRRSAR